MHHWQNFISIEDLNKERELRLINLKALRGELGFHPHAGEASLFLWLVFWASIKFKFTYVKWNNRQMDFSDVRSGNIVRSSNHR